MAKHMTREEYQAMQAQQLANARRLVAMTREDGWWKTVYEAMDDEARSELWNDLDRAERVVETADEEERYAALSQEEREAEDAARWAAELAEEAAEIEAEIEAEEEMRYRERQWDIEDRAIADLLDRPRGY